MPNLLIVDDAESVHETLKTLFTPMGYDVVCANGAREALAIYQKGGIEVVLCDVWMKPIDGITLLRKIKQIDPKSVVIMMTGFNSKEYILQSFKNGAFDFLEKPFGVEEVRGTLRRAFEQRQAQLSGGGGVASGEGDSDEVARLREQLATLESDITAKNQQLQSAAEQRTKQIQNAQELKFTLAEREDEIEGMKQQIAELQNNTGQSATPASTQTESGTDDSALKEKEASLRELESQLTKRQRQIDERLKEVEEREANLNEQMALMDSMDSTGETSASATDSGGDVNEQLAALEEKESQLRALEEELSQRQTYIDDSENMLFDKGQALQEREVELDQLKEDLAKREARAGSAPAGGDAASSAEVEAKLKELEEQEAKLNAREEDLSAREKQLKKTEALVRAREQFLRQSESILFEEKEG